jgi:hypothetical protein
VWSWIVYAASASVASSRFLRISNFEDRLTKTRLCPIILERV